MMLIKSLYELMLRNDFNNFCNLYEKSGTGSLSLFHDKWTSTAYLSQELQLSDTKYQKFIDFLVDKAVTPQVVALLIYQNNDLASRYWGHSQIRVDIENTNVLINAAVQGFNKKAIIDLSKNNLEKVINLVLQSDYKEAQLSLMDLVPHDEKYSKLILGTFIQLAQRTSAGSFDYAPYLYFLEKYPVNGKDFLDTYLNQKTSSNSLEMKIWSLVSSMGREDDLLFINSITGGSTFKKPEWYDKIFHPLSEITILQKNEKIINSMYFNLLLNKSLKEKEIKKSVAKI